MFLCAISSLALNKMLPLFFKLKLLSLFSTLIIIRKIIRWIYYWVFYGL